MKVVPVEPIGVELFWDKIKPLVKKATDYSGGRHTVDTTKYLCETGMMNLWLVFKDVKNIEGYNNHTKSYLSCKNNDVSCFMWW